MKKLYSALATLALFFSLSGFAATLADKSQEKDKSTTKESSPSGQDKIKVERPQKGSRQPICGGLIG
jgi:hypothetical protein